jgi:hypothetical protein
MFQSGHEAHRVKLSQAPHEIPPGSARRRIKERKLPRIGGKLRQARIEILEQNETDSLSQCEVIENVVARDGVEPPTPAFSGLTC